MKIMHVIESLGIGGAEQVLVTLSPSLQRLGNDVMVVVRTDRLELGAALEAAGVRVILLPTRHKWNLIGTALNIARLANENGIDVIHAHLYFPAQATALVKLLRLHSAATVVTFHNLAYAHGVNTVGMKLRLKKTLAAFLYPRGFDRKIAVSSAVAAHYRTSLGLDCIEVVHNPVDIDAIDNLHLQAERMPTDSLHIVVPGRLVHGKGHFDLLEALVLLRAQGLVFTATIAGGGPMRRELERQVHLVELESSISFTGSLEHAKLLEIVATADIVVIPSRFEGFGLAAIEAMALSRPVIVTAVGGLLEIVEDGCNGIVVPAKNPRELAAALRRLMSSPVMRKTLGSAGRSRVEQAFALPLIAKRMHALYEETVTLNQVKKPFSASTR